MGPEDEQGPARALAFIRATREDPELAAKIEQLDPDEGLEPVLRVAAAAGFELTAEQLRAAYRHDWALRRIRYAEPDS